ncbi:MAG: methionyl-tRNA formyltransferase [Nitrospira sp. SB0675_bin_23]|nr:methionyl-tRNA formyltransferase [Nitrospira sp. SB0661_bin_20]MYH01385.1 methionyl-tRNA formyltransferase [Nitrospira sp. SB0675_bin_23]MYJ23269.1 methionyl-tRNA formyltransferase [Nitrospira sp. SB0673_bin_12]
MRVVFMGTPVFAVPSLEALDNSDHEVVGVVTQPDRPKGRGQAVVSCPVKELALSKGLPVWQPDKIKSPEFLQQLSEWKPDVIAVTAFGRILPKVILDLPPMGCVNVHASLLPAYRGAAPIQWALIHGDTETGVTTMVMDEGMDTGAVLLQQTIPIEPEDTSLELGNRMALAGGALLVETLTRLVARTVVPRAQDHSRATMAPLLKKEDGVIDWTQSATEIANRIRGLSPWPGSYTFHHACPEQNGAERSKQRLIIRKGRVDAQGGLAGGKQQPGTILAVGPKSFWVETGEGRIEVLEVQPANKKRMSVEQFLLGYALRAQETLSPQSRTTWNL